MRTLWVSAVAGGPFKYTGENLAEAHRDLRISPKEFDAVEQTSKKHSTTTVFPNEKKRNLRPPSQHIRMR